MGHYDQKLYTLGKLSRKTAVFLGLCIPTEKIVKFVS